MWILITIPAFSAYGEYIVLFLPIRINHIVLVEAHDEVAGHEGAILGLNLSREIWTPTVNKTKVEL